ncbi:hypothetical protein [Microbacterium sp. JZ31]|uniref:hypothetical protein n=1 Tax=Microbacterium sp. JZ31 TaxID=1906274 RepID=UPI001934A374|nr:hypothetical protein [Microbacterium sp. JZ31]
MTRMMIVGRWARYAVLLALALVAVVLIAPRLMGGPVPASAPAPSDTAEPLVGVEPTPTTSPLPADPERRFLALDGGGVLWRGTAGSCTDGIPPKLERTADAVVWRTATPAGAAQLLALEPGDARDQARIVIATDDGSCGVAEQVTAADGQSWESPVTVEFAVEEPVAGVLATTDGGYVARDDEGCDGVAFSGDAWTACDPALDPADPIAIDHADGKLYVWSGDVVTAVEVAAG